MGTIDMFTRKKNTEPNLADQLEVLHRALSSGVSAHEAFSQAGLTARQYGAALFHAKALPHRGFDPSHRAVFRQAP